MEFLLVQQRKCVCRVISQHTFTSPYQSLISLDFMYISIQEPRARSFVAFAEFVCAVVSPLQSLPKYKKFGINNGERRSQAH
jgi:hypothetical protein